MNSRFTPWFPLGILFLLATLTFWLERTVQPPPPKRDGSGRHDADYSVENFSATRMGQDGTPRYILAASKMVHYPDDDTTHLEQPHFTQLDKDKPALHILAQQGLISSDGEHAYFSGEVQVVREASGSAGRLTMSTPFLHVIPDQNTATTGKTVTIRDPHTVITAVGLELNSKTRILKLLSRVKGTYDNPKH